MKRWVFVLSVCLLFARPVFAQHGPHADLVAKAQQDLRAAGIDLSGDCGAFKVTNLAAVYIRAAGDTQAGLLFKTAGSGCSAYGGQLFAKDAIVYPNGEVYDTIIASGAMGGNGGPTWNKADNRSDVVCPCPPGLWRNPVDPTLYGFGSTPGPTPTPTPIPVPVPTLDLSGVYQRIDWSDANNERRYQDLKAEAAAAAARDAALAAQLKAHDEKAGVLAETFGNRYVQLALAVLGTIITQQQVTK